MTLFTAKEEIFLTESATSKDVVEEYAHAYIEKEVA